MVGWGRAQPSNTGKAGMFRNVSPRRGVLHDLGVRETPEKARTATMGLHLMEVFPALTLPSLAPKFFGRLTAQDPPVNGLAACGLGGCGAVR